MSYTYDSIELKRLFSTQKGSFQYDGVEFHKFTFNSSASKMLPGGKNYRCNLHHIELDPSFSFYTEIGRLQDDVHIKDIEVTENQSFSYHLILPAGMSRCRKVTFLFHGFNERDWYKYLPWALQISKGTQSAVVLFPIAFHMQRAPKHWSLKREMYKLSEERKLRFPHIINSSLSNVAISMRLHSMPQRFIWSGLQTYYDTIAFIEDCKNGLHPMIDPGFSYDIFAYSIGGFLAQVLKLTNFKGYFDATKVCIFCGGATFNRLSPVSKFILDSEANVALYSFLVEHFDKILEKDSLLRHYIKEEHMEGMVFSAMLDYQKMREFRETLLKRYEDQFYAIALRKDAIIPSFEVVNTLQGAWRTIKIRVDEMDFDREYTHENPFPLEDGESRQIDHDFALTFQKVCDFFTQQEPLP